MVSINKSSSFIGDSSTKSKPFDDTALRKLQIDIQPYLKDKNLSQLKSIIEKYENLSVYEIENYLKSDIRRFRPETLHKVRDFVRRRLRQERQSGPNAPPLPLLPVAGNAANHLYHSDESNLVSPYSRDSFSSKSDANLSPNNINTIKSEIERLWQYPQCQKEICQLLWNRKELEISSHNEIAINFPNLRQSTLVALNEFISAKNMELQQHLSNENYKIIHDFFLKENITDDKICEIHRIIRKREKIAISENGKFLINVHNLKPETVSDLVSFLTSSKIKTEKPNRPYEMPPSSQRSLDNHKTSVNNVNNNIINPIRATNNIKPVTQERPKSRFTTDQLRTLSQKIKHFASVGRLDGIIEIFREHETVGQETGVSMSFNVRQMKDVTIEKLFKLINSYEN